jgi:hypothetical protein
MNAEITVQTDLEKFILTIDISDKTKIIQTFSLDEMEKLQDSLNRVVEFYKSKNDIIK